MKSDISQHQADVTPGDRSALSTSQLGALEAIFRHPTAHNLEWRHVVELLGHIGEVTQKAGREFAVQLGGQRHMLTKPHGKDLTESDVIDLRAYLTRAGWSLGAPVQSTDARPGVATAFLVVVNHKEANVYHLDVGSDDPAAHSINPGDPHHFVHHVGHMNKPRERGRNTPGDITFFEDLSKAMTGVGKIVVVSSGTGKSNAGHHWTDYLETHASGVHDRIVSVLVADLSRLTTPQLLDLGRSALR